MSEENKDSVVETTDIEINKPVEAVEEASAITLPVEEKTGPGLGEVASGAIASTQVKSKDKPKAEKPKHTSEDTVALYSTRNVFWDGVGKVGLGINIVSKSDSEQWLKRNHIRLATPAEVAKEFGK
jgi:hypothetical protein